jgi:hypothetical protein
MEWRTASASGANGSCVTAGAARWLKSEGSYANGNCVEAGSTEFFSSAASDKETHCVQAGGAEFMASEASHANNGCVEAASATFAAASASEAGNCVEAASASFAKSRASGANGSCIEAASDAFAAASASNLNGHCIEAGSHDGVVFLRDSKDPDGPHLHFPAASWDGGKAVVFRPVPPGEVPEKIFGVARERGHDTGQRWFSVSTTDEQDRGTVLWFDQAEVTAWFDGVAKGEFQLALAAA